MSVTKGERFFITGSQSKIGKINTHNNNREEQSANWMKGECFARKREKEEEKGHFCITDLPTFDKCFFHHLVVESKLDHKESIIKIE